jgi:hypothetical protein
MSGIPILTLLTVLPLIGEAGMRAEWLCSQRCSALRWRL